MRSILARLFDALKGSYWFLPAVMTVGAMVLAWTMITLDWNVKAGWLDGLPWLDPAHPDGARQMLSAISGSTITVAGTIFSVTIAAVVYASGQYGPRLLSNFMNDRGNQVTLGTFIATFVYCLLVLRTVRSADESSGGVEFVPDLAVLVAVILALCSTAVLIFFIHHVPSKLHINNVIEAIGDKLIRGLDDRFAARRRGSQGDQIDEDSDASIPAVFRESADPTVAGQYELVPSRHSGYIQFIDHNAILEQAEEGDLVFRLRCTSGDFVHRGRPFLEVWPPSRCSEEAGDVVRSAFGLGARRTALQDLRFLIDELVEIATRALSPGINDPFTAITCLDWLGAAMSDLANRDMPSRLLRDQTGVVRIITLPVTFEGLLDRSFGALARHCASDMIAALHYLRALGEACRDCGDPRRVAIIARQVGVLSKLAEGRLAGENLVRVQALAAELRAVMAGPEHQYRLRRTLATANQWV